LDLLREMILEPNLANDDFNRLRNLRLERIKQMKDHAGALAERVFARALYDAHPYGHLSLGSEGSLTAMTVDAARALHQSLFTPVGATLEIARDPAEQELLAMGAESFRA